MTAIRLLILLLAATNLSAGNENPLQNGPTSPMRPGADSTQVTINLRAGEKSSLRRQLSIATGVSSALVKAAPSVVADDEIYWDGFDLCGDGVIDSASEQCDRSDFGGASCLTQGFTDGVLTCDATCQIDASQCSGACPIACDTDADCGICGPCLTTFSVCFYGI